MAIRKIVKFGDSVLEKECRPVEKFDKKLHQLLDDMKETLAMPMVLDWQLPKWASCVRCAWWMWAMDPLSWLIR